jgi:hypothetical protein
MFMVMVRVMVKVRVMVMVMVRIRVMVMVRVMVRIRVMIRAMVMIRVRLCMVRLTLTVVFRRLSSSFAVFSVNTPTRLKSKYIIVSRPQADCLYECAGTYCFSS